MPGKDFIPQIKPDSKDLEEKPDFQKLDNTNQSVNQAATQPVNNPVLRRQQVQGGRLRRFSIRNKFNLFKTKKPNKWILGVGIGLLVFITITLLLSFNLYLKSKALMTEVKKFQVAATAQDFPLIKPQLEVVDKKLASVSSAYGLLSYTKLIPFVGSYVRDGSHVLKAADHGIDMGYIVLDTVEPYADLVGFKGNDTGGNGQQTAADRIDFLVKTIPEIVPKLTEIEGKMALVKKETDKINPNRYPKSVFGRPVREPLTKGLDLVDEMTNLVTNGKPVIEQAPYLLGLESPRTYLVLFQNDKELRPSGGFITAYSIMKVDKAKFEPVSSDDIYHLDAKYKPQVEAPDPIIDYLKGPYTIQDNLFLRDMNWSPDFRESMELFMDEADTVGLEDVDGVVAVDTGALVNLLDVLGTIGVAGFGNFSTEIIPECNCPQVIYELESFADVEGPVVWDPAGTGKIIYQPPNADNRKRIIGPLMNSIFAHALGQPKQKLGELFNAGLKSLTEKHLLLYLFDDDAQKAAEDFNIAGRIQEFEGDYLHINDANLGGRKSNLYVTQDINQEIKVARDGSVEKTVTITYNNPEKYDGWLNSVLPNWVRIYVPKGSELIAFEGIQDQKDPYEEFGKTVYAGFFELRPQGVAKVIVKYKLPFKVKNEYNLLIQKQPGKDAPLYTTSIGKVEEEHLLKADKEFKYRI